MLCYCVTADAYGSLRCNGKIIDSGITMAKVLALCGPPKNRVIEQVPVRSRTVTGFSRFSGVSYTELWEYDRGWGKFPAVLHVDEGEIRRIDHLSRRSGD